MTIIEREFKGDKMNNGMFDKKQITTLFIIWIIAFSIISYSAGILTLKMIQPELEIEIEIDKNKTWNWADNITGENNTRRFY